MGIARGGTYLIPWNVYNFLPDIDEAYTGVRREGSTQGDDADAQILPGAGAVYRRRRWKPLDSPKAPKRRIPPR